MNNFRMPAYAGAAISGATRAPTFGMLGSRRNRFWFGVIGLLALCLPYAALATASVKAALGPPNVVTPLPNVVLPAVRFPVLAVPKATRTAAAQRGAGVRGASGPNPPGGSNTSAGAASRSASTTQRAVQAAGTRRLVHPGGSRGTARQPIPVQRSSYSLVPAPAGSAGPGPAAGVIGGLAHALANAPTVINTQPPPPLPSVPAPVVVPAPSASTSVPTTTSAPTVSVTGGAGTVVTTPATPSSTSHLRRGHLVAAAPESVATASTPSADASSPGPSPAAPVSSPDPSPAAPATTPAPAPAAASTPDPTPAADANSTPPAGATASDTAATDSSTPAISAPPAAADQIQSSNAPSSATADSSSSSGVDPQAAAVPAASSASDSSGSGADSPAATPDSQPASTPSTGSSDSAAGANSTGGASSSATVTPQPAIAGDSSNTVSPSSALSGASGGSRIAYAGAAGVQTTEVGATTATESVIAAPVATVALSAPAIELAAASAGTTIATAGLPAVVATTQSAGVGATTIDGGGANSSLLAAESVAASPGSTAGSGADGPSTGSAVVPGAAGATPSSGSGDPLQATEPAPPSADGTVSSATSQVFSNTASGTLGARGPPAVYGPVLIHAAQGGSISAGNATLTFAPGSLPHDAEVSVTVSSVSVAGLGTMSSAYDLTAVDTVTGALIEQFAIAPQLTIAVAPGTTSPSIYYLPPAGAPVAIASAYDPTTGTVSAGLPHFSTYTAATTISDLIGFIQSSLASALSGTTTITAPNDLTIGGVIELGAPSLTFSNLSVTGSGANALYTGTVTISSAGGGIDTGSTGPVNATFGTVTGTYTLAGQAASAGTLTVALSAPSISIRGFVSLGASSLKVTYADDGTTKQTMLGATGVSATLTAGTGGPTASLSNASLGLLARTPDAGGSPTFAVLATGDVALSGAGSLTLTGTGWQAAYDALGDLSAAPVTIDTGAGTVVLNLAQPTGVSGTWTSLSGSAALTLGTVGSLNGVFALKVSGSTFNVTASGVSAQIAAGSAAVTVTGASGMFSAGTTGAQGLVNGAARLVGVPGLTLTAALAVSFDTTAATPSFAITGTGALELPAFLDLSGSLSFSRSGSAIAVSITGTSVSAAAQINADGTFAAAGTVTGSLPAVLAPLSLSDTSGSPVTLSLDINTSTTDVTFTTPAATAHALTVTATTTGTPKLTTPLGDLAGSFTFTRDLASQLTTIDVTGATLFLGQRGATSADDVGLQLGGSGGFAHLVLEPNGTFALRAEGTATVLNVSDLTFTGTFRGELNTTGSDVTLPDAGSTTAPVAAGTAALTGTGVTLAVGGFSLTGNFAVAKSPGTGPAGATELLIGATGLTVAIGPSSGTQLTVSGAGLGLVVEPDHSYTLQASGLGALTGLSGVTLTGLIGVQRNTQTSDIARQIQVGGDAYTVNVPRASNSTTPYSHFSGQGIAIALLGQQLSGDLIVTPSANGVSLALTNVAAQLGSGLASITGGSATLAADTTNGFHGSFGASALSLAVPGITAAGAVTGDILLPTSGTGGHFTMAISGAAPTPVLTVGTASLSGTFTLAAGNGGVTITGSSVALSFGTYVQISGASGSLQLSSAGVAADISASATVALPGFAPSGALTAKIQVNTTRSPVTVGAETTAIPAGPYIQAAVTVPKTTVFNASSTSMGSLAGNFLFQQQSVSGATTTLVGMNAVSVWLPADAPASPTISGGQGLLVISTDSAHPGFAGYVSGTASVGGTGYAASGNVILQINTTGGPVNATVTLGGQQLTVDYGAGQGNLFSISVSDLTIQIGQNIWLSGSVSLTSGVNAGSPSLSGSTFAGSGLTVFFGNGPGLLANGDANPLAVGLLITNANVVLFTDGNGKYALDASGTVALVGTNGVSASGTGRVRVNEFQSTFNETVALPGSGTSLPLVFQSSSDVATATAPSVSVGGLGLNLNVFGQTLTGDLSLSDTAGAITVAIANASVSLSDGNGNVSSRGPPLATLTNGSGQLKISSTGVVGGLSGTVAITIPGASVSGTFTLALNTTGQADSVTVNSVSTPVPAGNFFSLNASQATITVGAQSLTGNLTLQRTTTAGLTTTTLAVTGATFLLGDGTTTFLSLDAIAGSLTVTGAGVAGSLSAHLASSPLPGLTANTLSVAVNTTPDASGDLPAGPYLRAELTGATLTVGTQTLSGDFGFQRSTDASSAPIVIAAVNNLNASLGGGIATLSQGTGAVLLSSAGIAGTASGTLSLHVPGVTLDGTLTVQFNRTGGSVDKVFTLGGTPITLSLPAGNYISVAGTGVTLTALDQAISGDVTLTTASGVTTLTLANGTLSLGGGLVTVSGAAGSLTVDATGVSTGLTGLTATVATSLPGIAFGTGLTVGLDTHPGSARLVVEGTGTTLTVAGQTLSGDFVLQRGTDATGASALKIAFTNSSAEGALLSLGGGAVTVADGSGQLLITAAGMAGALSISGVSVVLPSGVTLGTGTYSMAVSTLPTAVTEPFTINSSTQTLTLPAGPYVSVTVGNVDLTLPGGTLHGDFTFERQGSGASAQTVIAAANVGVITGGATLSDGSGAFVIAATGVAGILQATVTVGNSSVSGGGHAVLRANTINDPVTKGAVDATVNVGGQPIEVQFGQAETPFFNLSIDGLTFNVGNFVTIQGNVSLGSYTLADSTAAQSFAGNGLSVFLGQGPGTLASGAPNPLATGILISGAQVGLIQIGSTYAFVATGTATVLGATGLTLTGTVSVAFNNTGKVLNETLTIPGSAGPGVAVDFTGPNPGAVQLIGGQLGVLGQNLSGNFAFSTDSTGIAIAATGVSLSLGSGAVAITGASGSLHIGAGSLAGVIAGTVTASVPGVTLGGTYTLAINTGPAPVSDSVVLGGQTVALDLPAGPFLRVTGSQTTLTILSQTLTGDFSIQSAQLADGTTATTIVAANVSLSFGGSGATASLTGGQGALLVTGGGVAGALSANVTLTLPTAVSLVGDFALQINTTTSAVSQSFTVGTTTVALTVPAGPYLRLEATGATLTVAGQILSGDFAVAKVTSQNAGTILELGVANGSVALGGSSGPLSITGVTGALFVDAGQVAGTLAATVALHVPGLVVAGTLGLQINTGGAVTDSFTVGGTQVDLTLLQGPFVQVTGTGVTLTVLGQKLTGDIAISRQIVAGSPQLQIRTQKLTGAFGGTAGTPVLTATETAATSTFVISSAGLAGSIGMGIVLAPVPGVALSGTFSLDVNTTGAATGGLPAGPYLRLDATAATLTILGQQLTGNLALVATTNDAGASVLTVGISNGALNLLGGAVSASGISGLMQLSGGAIAGTLTASLSLDSSLGVSLTGTYTLAVNTGSTALATSLTVGGQALTLDLPAGPYLSLEAIGASLRALGQTISGDFTLTQVATGPGDDGIPGNADDPKAVAIAIANGSLGLGDGKVNFLTLTGISGDLLLINTPAKTTAPTHPAVVGIAGQLTAAVSLQNLPGVSLGGTFGLVVNSTNQTISALIPQPGSPTPFALSLATGHYLQVSGTGVTITAGGQTLSGNFSFTAGTGVLTLTFDHVALGVGDGTTNFISVTNGSGNLSLISNTTPGARDGGVYGTFTGDVASTVPGLAFTSTLTIELNTTPATHGGLAGATFDLTATNPTLTVAGQSVSAASVTLTVATVGTGSAAHKVISASLTDLSLQFGSIVNLPASDHATGALIIDGHGVAGQFTASLAGGEFNVPGVTSFTATGITVNINTGGQAVNQTVGSVTIDVPAGPVVQIVATGAQLQVGGSFSLGGNFAFDQSSQPGFASTAYGSPTVPTASSVTAIASADVNGDGFPDLFLAVTGAPSQLWLNRGKDASGNWLGLCRRRLDPVAVDHRHRRRSDHLRGPVRCQPRRAARSDRRHRRRHRDDQRLSQPGSAVHDADLRVAHDQPDADRGLDRGL